jgi:hypothetical protein
LKIANYTVTSIPKLDPVLPDLHLNNTSNFTYPNKKDSGASFEPFLIPIICGSFLALYLLIHFAFRAFHTCLKPCRDLIRAHIEELEENQRLRRVQLHAQYRADLLAQREAYKVANFDLLAHINKPPIQKPVQLTTFSVADNIRESSD